MNPVNDIEPSAPYAKMAMHRAEGEILHFKLLQWFPYTIKRVTTYYVAQRDERMALVEFKNNYQVTRPIKDLFSTECRAMCLMVHDLPMRDHDT